MRRHSPKRRFSRLLCEGSGGGANAKPSIDDSVYALLQSAAVAEYFVSLSILEALGLPPDDPFAALFYTPMPDELAANAAIVTPPTPQLPKAQCSKTKTKAARQPHPYSKTTPKKPKDESAFRHYVPQTGDPSLLQVPERNPRKRYKRQVYDTSAVATPASASSTRATPAFTADTPSTIVASTDIDTCSSVASPAYSARSVAVMSPVHFQPPTPSSVVASPHPQLRSSGRPPYQAPHPTPPPRRTTQIDPQSPVELYPGSQPTSISSFPGPSHQVAEHLRAATHGRSFGPFHDSLVPHSLPPGPPLRRPYPVFGHQAPAPPQLLGPVPVPQAHTARPAHIPSYQPSGHHVVYGHHPFGPSLAPEPYAGRPHHVAGNQAPAAQQVLGPVPVPPAHTAGPAHTPSYQSMGRPLGYDHRLFGPSSSSFVPNQIGAQVPTPRNPSAPSSSLTPGPYAQYTHPYEYSPGPYYGS